MIELVEKIKNIFQIPFVEGIIGAIVTYVFLKLKLRVSLRPLKKIWRIFKDDTIFIILPGITQDSFYIPIVKQHSKIPKNVKLMPFSESIGIAELQKTLEQLFPKKRIVLSNSENFFNITDSYISIGGPSVNKITHDLLNVHKIDYGFQLIYPDHYAIDDVAKKRYKCDEDDNQILNDYGFIFISNNPHNSQKKVCVLCGVWAHGTYSAIQALTSSKMTIKQIAKYLKKNKNILIVTKSNVSDVNTGAPTIDFMRPLQNK